MVAHPGVTLPATRVRPFAAALLVASTCLPWSGLGLTGQAWADPADGKPADTPPKTGPVAVSRTTVQAPSSPPADKPAEAVPKQLDHAIPAKLFRYSERLLQQGDSDGDGRLNRREWGRVWGFLMTDANRDGAVDLNELVRRVASYGRNRKIRLMDPLAEVAETVPPLLNPTTDLDSGKVANGEPPPPDEIRRPGEDPSAADASQSEGRRRDTKFFVPRARLPEGLPGWFVSRDADGDGQLTMAEFAPKATRSELVEFDRYDADGDGVITARECVRAARATAERESP